MPKIPMSDLNCWFDAAELTKAPFLAINLSNRKARSKLHNDALFPKRVTGDWPLTKEVMDVGIEGKTLVLFYTERGRSTLYVGRCTSKKVVSATANGQPRYQLTVAKAWKAIGATDATYSKFFEGFRMSSNPTVVWAADSTYVGSLGTNDTPDDRDPDDDGKKRAGGTNVMTLVAQRACHDVFVDRLKSVWGKKCALTRLTSPRLVQACHLVPWSNATPKERISAHNGLMLCAHLHALLDSHLLSFDDEGNLLLATDLAPDVRKLVLASGHICLSKPPSSIQVGFLQRHRKAAKLKRKKLERASL
jgi:hypothetical protein